EESFDQVLRDAVARRDWLEALSRLGARDGDPCREAEQIYRTALGITTPSLAAVEQQLASVLSEAELRRAASVLATGTRTDSGHAEVLERALAASDPKQRADALGQYFLTGKGEPRASLMTKGLKSAYPDLDAILSNAQARFAQ